MVKKEITKKDFYNQFMEHLKEGKDFELKNKIVEGDINILEIYEKIKGKELKGATIEQKDNKIIININIDIHLYDIKFKENFKLSETAYTTRYILPWDENYKIDHEEKGDNYYFKIIFNGKTDFEHITFEGKADFGSAVFKHAKFNHTTFEKDADFKDTISGKLEFDKSTFEDVAYFRDIYFGLLSFVDCTFKGMAEFRNKIKSEEESNNGAINEEILIELENMGVNEEILNEIKRYNNIAIFNNAQFLNKHSKIKNFQLSKTSFLMTDVREVMLLCDIKKEKILSHALYEDNLNENKNKEKTENNKNKPDESRDNEQTKNENNTYYHILNSGYYYFNELIGDIDDKSVLAEYRNLRISVEDNITYEKASNLYKMEMEFKKKYSKNNFEKIAIRLYEILSNCGESVEKSVLWIVSTIALLPLFALSYNYIFSNTLNWSMHYNIILLLFTLYFILSIYSVKLENNKLIYLIICFLIPLCFLRIFHEEILRDTITAFFQLKIDNMHFMKNWEPLIRVISLILLGNLYIALRRRLSRK
jgi:hypothetical protein